MGLRRIAFLVGVCCLSLFSCQPVDLYDYVYSPPPALDDGLETASLEAVGMATGPIRAMMDHINGDGMHRIHDILILKNDRLVFEETTYPYSDPRNDITAMFAAADPLRYVLDKPLTSPPGGRFFYNSGTTNVLAAAVARAAGMSFLDYANRRLLDPLNNQGGEWKAFPSGHTFASGGLFLRPRELAKIGLLYLNDGLWKGEPIVDPEWISRSLQQHVSTIGFPFAFAYGYLWWIRDFAGNGATHRCYFAAGWGDQYLFLIPALDMIIVFNCGNYRVNARISPFDLVEEYILKALD